MQKGWIKLHRKLLNNPIFQDPYLLKIWMYCLLKASHSKHKQLVGKEIVELDEGQFIWGRIEATVELNKGTKQGEKKSESTWERYLKLLENLEILNRETNNKCTIVTIAKWAIYQDGEGDNEQVMNNKRTSNEQQVNTNKNVKNVKNVKKENKRHKFSTRDMSLAKLLFHMIRQNNANHKEPNLEKWASDIRLMRERDQRTEEQIEYLIKWSQSHSFWHTNILSTAKLRQQFDTLIMQVKQDKKSDKVVPMRKELQKEDGYDYGF